jgi:hypothetical protein
MLYFQVLLLDEVGVAPELKHTGNMGMKLLGLRIVEQTSRHLQITYDLAKRYARDKSTLESA